MQKNEFEKPGIPLKYAQAFVIPRHAHVRYICASMSDCIRHRSHICLTYADAWISEPPFSVPLQIFSCNSVPAILFL